MSGKHDERGQLALLDAMVFFAIALLVSSMLAGMARDAPVAKSDRGEEAYAESALRAFLEASLGRTVLLELDGPVEIKPWEKVGDCLMAELHAIRDGRSPSDFEPLNAVLMDMLGSIVARPYRFTLSVFGPLAEGSEPLLALSNLNHTSSGDWVYASSASLGDQDGALLTIVLQLVHPRFLKPSTSVPATLIFERAYCSPRTMSA